MLRSGLAALLVLSAGPAVAQPPAYETPGYWPVHQAETAGYPYNVQYGGHTPGGYEARIGRPYYWSVPGGTTSLAAIAGGPAAAAGGGPAGCGCNNGGSVANGPFDPVYGGGFGDAANDFGGNGVAGYGADSSPTPFAGAGPPVGSAAADPYAFHFGPGYYRSGEFGHYRFPYYSYRRPWYDVGHPVYVRDTNLPW